MSKKKVVPCNCVQCKENVLTKGERVSVFWFSGTARDGYRIHHERGVHVVVRGGAVIRIEEQSEFCVGGFLAVGHDNCTRDLLIDPVPFNPYEGMSHDDAVAGMIRLVLNTIRSASEGERKGRKKKRSAVA